MPTKDQSAQQTPYLGYLLIIIVCVSITLLSIPLALCITPKYNAKVIKKGEEDREPIPPKSNDSFLVRASIFRISQGLTKPLSVMSTADRTKSEQSLSRNSIQSAKE